MDNEDGVPAVIIIIIVILFLSCLIGSLACCTMRCFASEQTVGQEWISTSDGNPQFVKSAFQEGEWVQEFRRNGSEKPDVFGPLSIYAQNSIRKPEKCIPDAAGP